MLHRSRIQNENDPRTGRGKLYTGADGPHTGKKASLGAGKAVFDPENQTSSKPSKPPTAMPRKALGDITNATPVSFLPKKLLDVGSEEQAHLGLTIPDIDCQCTCSVLETSRNYHIPKDAQRHAPFVLLDRAQSWPSDAAQVNIKLL